MKTKSFLVFSTSVFATSIFLIIFHSQQPDSIQNIVTQTHQHIKDFQDNLRDVEENNLVQEEKYLHLVGFDGGTEPWRNTTLPTLVTYARGDAHAHAIGFVRAVASKLPHTVLLYNLGLNPHSLKLVGNHCNTSKCVIIDFDLNAFPSHVSDDGIHAFRPLVIQHALTLVGGVIFAEVSQRWRGSLADLDALWKRAAGTGGSGGKGIVAWPRRAAVTSLTHPRMFHYFNTSPDDFFFVQMVDVSRLVLVNTPDVEQHVMRPWVQCALTHDCITPIGAQSGGCRFDKKPQYRYSGCHSHDSSALNIVLGLRFGLDESHYTWSGHDIFSRVSEEQAILEYSLLERNSTTSSELTDMNTEHNVEASM